MTAISVSGMRDAGFEAVDFLCEAILLVSHLSANLFHSPCMFVRVETAAGSYLIGGIAEKIADRLSQLIASVKAAVLTPWALDEAG
jgi:hypothetical protein